MSPVREKFLSEDDANEVHDAIEVHNANEVQSRGCMSISNNEKNIYNKYTVHIFLIRFYLKCLPRSVFEYPDI